MTKRTDSHRPSTIVPADYSYVLSYHLATSADGWPVPPFNIDAVIELQNTKSFARTGSIGKCSVCGAHFIYGDIWQHDNGEHIHIGWECAEKYAMLVDRSAFEMETSRRKSAAAVAGQRAHNAQLRAAFLAEHAGLEAALKTPHDIVADIAYRFLQWNTISDKQIALVMKLAAEAAAPQRKEIHVPAPTGRQTFRGVVVSTKSQEGGYGVEYKMTVKVTTEEGTWLAWGTIPNALLESVPVGERGRIYTLRGLEVEITATLQRGKDEHFAVAKRPTGRLQRRACGTLRHRPAATAAARRDKGIAGDADGCARRVNQCNFVEARTYTHADKVGGRDSGVNGLDSWGVVVVESSHNSRQQTKE